MISVGLTGSIAVGKTYVSNVLLELGCNVLDADLTAREVVEPNTAGWRKIVNYFGAEILQSDNTINRVKLGAIVFADESKRKILNSIVHPLVSEAQNLWIERIKTMNSGSIAIIDAALMIESGGYKRFDKIIVVWCEAEIQISRLMSRNNLDRATALQRINAQMSQDEKKKHADFTIDTSNGFEDTRRQVERLHQSLVSLVNS
ncbi:MAG: dephospho-CoA kinase [Pyrinomonadaceae bacterium]|nr:dephospho-CoA kinase [Pyrinomonadaceae bacterium]